MLYGYSAIQYSTVQYSTDLRLQMGVGINEETRLLDNQSDRFYDRSKKTAVIVDRLNKYQICIISLTILVAMMMLIVLFRNQPAEVKYLAFCPPPIQQLLFLSGYED